MARLAAGPWEDQPRSSLLKRVKQLWRAQGRGAEEEVVLDGLERGDLLRVLHTLQKDKCPMGDEALTVLLQQQVCRPYNPAPVSIRMQSVTLSVITCQ